MIVARPQVDTLGKLLISAAPWGWEDEIADLKKTHIVGKHEARGAAQPLADLVDRPPGDLFHLERTGFENALRPRDDVFGGDVAARDPVCTCVPKYLIRVDDALETSKLTE